MKGLSQVLGLSWLYFYTKVKPKTWLRPFVNTAPGYRHFVLVNTERIIVYGHCVSGNTKQVTGQIAGYR